MSRVSILLLLWAIMCLLAVLLACRAGSAMTLAEPGLSGDRGGDCEAGDVEVPQPAVHADPVTALSIRPGG